MTHTRTSALFKTDLARSEQGSKSASAPEWIELFPAGPAINARDGRTWTLDPAVVLAAFAKELLPLAIDYEHGQAHRAPVGEEAPAAGWILALEERSGAVWARVEWTERAANQISAKEYRFISPEFLFDQATGQILAVSGAGLVNRPALVMTALSRTQTPPTKTEKKTMKAIAQALGLAETADEVAILAALATREDERKALCAALKVDEASTLTALKTTIDNLQTETATALASVAMNAAPEVAALKADLVTTKTALAALQKESHEKAIEVVLDEAAKAGKITPASRLSYYALCQMEGGIEKFKALAATLPVIAAPSDLDGKPAGTSAGLHLDSVALAAKARTYQDEQHAAGNTISISTAVAHVKAQQESAS